MFSPTLCSTPEDSPGSLSLAASPRSDLPLVLCLLAARLRSAGPPRTFHDERDILNLVPDQPFRQVKRPAYADRVHVARVHLQQRRWELLRPAENQLEVW
jgi:hypothetical protein